MMLLFLMALEGEPEKEDLETTVTKMTIKMQMKKMQMNMMLLFLMALEGEPEKEDLETTVTKMTIKMQMKKMQMNMMLQTITTTMNRMTMMKMMMTQALLELILLICVGEILGEAEVFTAGDDPVSSEDEQAALREE